MGKRGRGLRPRAHDPIAKVYVPKFTCPAVADSCGKKDKHINFCRWPGLGGLKSLRAHLSSTIAKKRDKHINFWVLHVRRDLSRSCPLPQPRIAPPNPPLPSSPTSCQPLIPASPPLLHPSHHPLPLSQNGNASAGQMAGETATHLVMKLNPWSLKKV